ncbi:cysteine hydrolase family protein [Pelagerythrobacter marinus]|uniref:cysteine hydrolase family protein n=1 Tax=Pelagerythrobacter marinus TaxID=538382 RepID=UPI002AC95E70|nr:isochorismatase family cysteine hydrolase [Pelagerythrobacter marinus]WPZ07630.1 isochorismatase family cysteine hydrolase [Pelagerythrobacter marinus]
MPPSLRLRLARQRGAEARPRPRKHSSLNRSQHSRGAEAPRGPRVSGTPGAQLDPRLAWDKADIILVKKRYSAFFRTGLDEVLDRHGIGELVLAGANTHACVRTSAIDAYQRDLRVILASDCLSSYDEGHAADSLRYIAGNIGRVLTNDEIR